MEFFFILSACILGAVSRRIQGGWFAGWRWVAFPLYFVAVYLCIPNLFEAIPVFSGLSLWMTTQTNNGLAHWFPPVRWMYRMLERKQELIPEISWIGIEEKGFTNVGELLIGFLTLLLIGLIGVYV